MNPRYRAMIWEQSRLAGIVAVWCLGVGLCLEACFFIFRYAETLSRNDVLEMGIVPALFGSALTGLLLLFRFDVDGNLAMGTDPRLFRLPVKTLPIVLTTLICRAVGLICVSTALIVGYNFLFEGELSLKHVLWIVELYLVIQALSWSNRSIPWARYALILLGLVAACLFLLTWGRGRTLGFVTMVEYIAPVLTWPPLSVVLIGGAAGIAVAGTHWDRHAERRGPPTPGELSERLADTGKGRTRPFSSPLAAQLWYEKQCFGKRLLHTSGSLFAVMLIAVAAITLTREVDVRRDPYGVLRWLWLLPPASLLVGAVIAGARSGLTTLGRRAIQPSYAMLRPVHSAELAKAKLFMLFDSLCLTFIGTLAISVVLFIIPHEPIIQLIGEALSRRDLTPAELVAIVGRPLILTLVLAWALLWVASWIHVAFLVTSMAFGMLGLWGDIAKYDHTIVVHIGNVFALFAIVFPMVCLAWLSRSAVRTRVLSQRTVTGIAIVWVALSLVFMTAGPEPRMGLWPVCISFSFIAWVVIPLALAPMTIYRKRHQ